MQFYPFSMDASVRIIHPILTYRYLQKKFLGITLSNDSNKKTKFHHPKSKKNLQQLTVSVVFKHLSRQPTNRGWIPWTAGDMCWIRAHGAIGDGRHGATGRCAARLTGALKHGLTQPTLKQRKQDIITTERIDFCVNSGDITLAAIAGTDNMVACLKFSYCSSFEDWSPLDFI